MSTPAIRPPALRSTHSWVQISNPDLAKLAALHLKSQVGLSADVQGLLQRCLAEPTSFEALARRIELWVDLSALASLTQSINEAEWKRQALAYLIVRQAHYPLLRHLFNVTRSEVNRIRSLVGAVEPPKKPKAIGLERLELLYSAWRQVSSDYESETERWIGMAERFPDLALASIYTTVVVEGTPALQISLSARSDLPKSADPGVVTEA